MKIHHWLSIVIFVLVFFATVAGLYYQTPGSPVEFTTIRGEPAVFQGSGLYRFDPAVLAREGKIWDAVNLFIGLPLFGLAVFFSSRNSLRGKLILSGLLFYFFYVYLQLMTMYAFNFMFLVYVAVYALSAVAFFLNLAEIDVSRLPFRVSDRFPRRLFIGYTFFVSAMLLFLWLVRIIPLMKSGLFPPELAGMSTLETQGFDLGMVVPLMFCSGIALWRRSAWGYFLASLSLSYGLLMSLTLPAWIAIPLIQDGKTNLVEAIPFLVICVIGITLFGLFFGNVRGEIDA